MARPYAADHAPRFLVYFDATYLLTYLLNVTVDGRRLSLRDFNIDFFHG